MTLEGIDTSKWQGHADWAGAARATGFAIAKATQGTTEVDPNYLATIGAFRAAGKPRGSYHYADGGDPRAEAAYFVAHNARQNGEIQVLDFESVAALGAVDQVGAVDPVGWAVLWCQEVLRLSDNLPLIYMNVDTLRSFDWDRLVALNVGLWLASWGTNEPDPRQWPFLICWQHSDSERLTGIPSNVDGDTFYGDAAVWQRYGANRGGGPVPAPVPGPPVPVPAPRPPQHAANTHIVVAGDNLTVLAHHFGVSVAALIAANVHAYPSLGWHPDLIQVGWQLTIPGGHAPAPAHVTVKAGDSLSSIAAAHGLTLAKIEALNPQFSADFDHIEPGQQVRIA